MNGQVGRTRVATQAGQQGFSQGYGLHSVQVNKESPRYHAKVCPPAVDVEEELTKRFASHPNSYDPFYDYSNGHWVSNLDPYLKGFRQAKQSVLVLSWTDTTNQKNYFSILARAHTSMMFVELMSAKCSLCSPALKTQLPRYFFKQGEKPEDIFGTLDDTTATKPLLHPAKATWPSSDLARERKFLYEELGGKFFSHNATDVLLDVYNLRPVMSTATLQFHVVQRTEQKTNAKFTSTWASFESVLTKCHRDTIVDDICGENPWMDHHMGFAVHGSNEVTTDAAKLKALATKLNLPFHVTPSWHGGGSGQSYAVYVIGGNGLGFAFQVPTGTYKPPRAPGDDGMLDLCSNGSCPKVILSQCCKLMSHVTIPYAGVICHKYRFHNLVC